MSQAEPSSLFSPINFGDLTLRIRIVMAAMTRGRARNAGHVPTDMHVEYYRQRATAGLILTEAVWVSKEAIGFINVPGLFTPEQVEGWRAVTTPMALGTTRQSLRSKNFQLLFGRNSTPLAFT